MKRNTFFQILGAMLVFSLFPSLASAATSANVEVILVEANNGGSGVDASLSAYTSTLKRLFKFDSYRKVSSNRVALDMPGEAVTTLGGQGGQLTMQAGVSEGNLIRTDLNWTRNGKKLLHTRLQLRKGTPALLGGPRSGDGSYLLLIIWK